MFKNLKLTHSIMAILIVSLLSSVALGATGIIFVSKMNSNVATIYNDNLLAVQQLGVANGSFGAMRTSFTKLLDRTYDDSYYQSILSNDKTLHDSLTELLKLNIDNNTKSQVEKLTSDYEAYYKYVEIVKNSKQQNKPLDDTVVPTLAKLGDAVLADLDTMTKYQVSNSNKIYTQSKSSYTTTRVTFLIQIVVNITILIAISVGIFILIKKSLKALSGIMNVLSSGDLSINIPTNETNEFGSIKKDLSLTISSVSTILKNIKANTDKIADQTSSFQLYLKR